MMFPKPEKKKRHPNPFSYDKAAIKMHGRFSNPNFKVKK